MCCSRFHTMYSLFTLAFALEPFVPRCRAAATVVVSASYFELDDISNRILRRAQDDADSNTGPSDSNVALIAACTTSGILILVCVIILLWFYRRRQRLNRPPRESIDGLMRSSIHVEELKQQYDLPISHAVVTIPRAALPRSDNASEIDKGQYWRGRPQKLVSAAGPPPRGLLASESSGTIRSITPRPHEQTISWVSDQQRSPVRAVELDFNPYRDPNDLGWSGGAEGTPRLRYVSAHPLPHLPPAALQAGTSPGTSHVSHSTHSRSFSSSAAHPHFKFVAPPSSRGTSTQAVAELAIQPPSESQSPASLNPTPTAAATPGHLPLSAATPRWPRFGFASGVPDDSEESPHTATTNATAYDWRRSEYVPTRQRTLTGPRDRRTQASTAKRQRTLSQPESLFSVYAAHGHGLEKDKPMSPSLPVISATPIPALPSIPIPGVPFRSSLLAQARRRYLRNGSRTVDGRPYQTSSIRYWGTTASCPPG
ncbi:hypothetical protein BKA62DRAFT_112266 [Auriculariales sp. MPI-PUGE-AT-0066]|nr:hypothetical protein BKA62DRAFT_112266 [Auriculariales sp. MPI-PUGE-AT-0066]